MKNLEKVKNLLPKAKRGGTSQLNLKETDSQTGHKALMEGSSTISSDVYNQLRALWPIVKCADQMVVKEENQMSPEELSLTTSKLRFQLQIKATESNKLHLKKMGFLLLRSS